MTGILIISAIAFLLYTQSGIFILLKNTGSRLNRVFFYISIYFGLWSVVLALLSTSSLDIKEGLWDIVVKGGWTLVPAFLFRFISMLVRKETDQQNHLYVYYAYLFTGITLFLAYITETLSWSLEMGLQDEERLMVFKLADGILYSMLVVSVIHIFTMILSWQKSLKWRREKHQFVLVAYPLLIATILVILMDYLFPAFEVFSHLRLPHVLFAPGYLGIAYGMIRYRFFSPEPARSAEDVLNELKQILFFCDANGLIQYTNKYSRQLVGFDATNWQAYDVYALFDDADEIRERIAESLEQGLEESFHLDLRPLNTDESIPVSISCAVLRDAYHDTCGIMFYGEDLREAISLEEEIFQRKKMEKHLRLLGQELEQTVHHRTRDLANSIREIQVMMTERIQAEESMRNEMEDMEVMLEEIYHRVKKNLRLIQSVTEATGYSQGENKRNPLISELKQRVQAILLIHEHTNLTMPGGAVDFPKFLEALANYFPWNQAPGKDEQVVEVIQSGAEKYMGIDHAVSLGLVVNELFNVLNPILEKSWNKSKHQPMRLGFGIDPDHHCHLTIVCPGAEATPELMDVHDTSANRQLIDMLVSDQLNGQMTMDFVNGLSIRISIPLPMDSMPYFAKRSKDNK